MNRNYQQHSDGEFSTTIRVAIMASSPGFGCHCCTCPAASPAQVRVLVTVGLSCRALRVWLLCLSKQLKGADEEQKC